MHDDHFLVIEASGSWVDGYDYNHWLPWSPGSRGVPEGHSFTYVGLNFIYFYLAKGIGITSPMTLMLINRIIHALFSVLVVYFGIKIVDHLGTRKNAVTVGWLLACTWLLPFLSVRNLVELVCVPFILWGLWLVIKKAKLIHFLWAGLLLGFAVSIRYQVGVFALGMAAVLFFQWKFKAFALFCLGVLLMFGLTQGVVDYAIWGYPFAEFIGYSTYNMNEGTEYIPNDNYFMYLLVLMGVFLVPLGLLLGIGFFKSWKKYTIIFIPTLSFILFHSFYPSKQERFIMPVLATFLILGVLGYEELKKRNFWDKFWKTSIKIFWVINIPLLLLASLTYSKKSRVETMNYFFENNIVPDRMLLEGTGESDIPMLPYFYGGFWRRGDVPRRDPNLPLLVYENYYYDYVVFFGEQDLELRIDKYREIYPEIEQVKICDPSMVDKFLRWLNPRNANEYIEIWRTNTPKES